MDPLFQILKSLSEHSVDFVLIGGMAAIAHGSPVLTVDVDVCVSFSADNLPRILAALRPLHPFFRHHPNRVPLPDEMVNWTNLKNLYLSTDLGPIDLLGELPGIGTHEELANKTVTMDVGGFQCRVLDLDTLIAAKKHAGRDKDQIGVRHLEAIKKYRQQNPTLPGI